MWYSNAVIIFRFDETDKAISTLQANNFNVLQESVCTVCEAGKDRSHGTRKKLRKIRNNLIEMALIDI